MLGFDFWVIERKFTLNDFEIISHMQPLFFVTLTIFSDVFTQTTKHLTCQLKLLARHLTESIGIIIIIIRHANIIKEKKNHMAAIAVFLNLMLHKTKIYLFLLYLVNHRSIWCKLVGFNCFLVKIYSFKIFRINIKRQWFVQLNFCRNSFQKTKEIL